LLVSSRDKADAASRAEGVVDPRWAELIAQAHSGQAEAAAAALALIEAFVKGDRSRALTDYIARCLGEFAHGGMPIELAFHLSSALPPILQGAGGEGDRRRAARSPRSTQERTDSSGKHVERRHFPREPQGGRNRGRRSAAWDKEAAEKRSRPRGERRRRSATPPSDTD
jgi:hypothetical protein